MKSVLSHVARFETMLFRESKGRIILKFTMEKGDAPQARSNVFRNIPGLALSWGEPSSSLCFDEKIHRRFQTVLV